MTRQNAYAQLRKLERFARQSKYRFMSTDVQGRQLRIESHGQGFLYSYGGEDVDYDTALVLIQNR